MQNQLSDPLILTLQGPCIYLSPDLTGASHLPASRSYVSYGTGLLLLPLYFLLFSETKRNEKVWAGVELSNRLSLIWGWCEVLRFDHLNCIFMEHKLGELTNYEARTLLLGKISELNLLNLPILQGFFLCIQTADWNLVTEIDGEQSNI